MEMYTISEKQEAPAAMASVNGGIAHAFETSVFENGSCREGYENFVLAMNEVAPFTKFKSLSAIMHRLGVIIFERA